MRLRRFVPTTLVGLLSLLSINAAVVAQSCDECGNHALSGCAGCATPQPELAFGGSTNLYWHDVCGCEDDPCLEPSCPISQPASWYVITDLLPLYRDQLEGVDFQVNGTTGENVLRESAFDTEFDSGVRVMLGRALGDWYRLEAGYAGSYGWEDSTVVRNSDANALGGTGNLLSPFSDFGVPAGIEGLDFNNFASVSFSSEMENVELNVRRRIRLLPHLHRPHKSIYSGRPGIFMNKRMEASCLIGLRYMRLEEQFEYLTLSDLPAGTGSDNLVNLGAENQMIGVQVGLLSQFLATRWSWIDVELKGGVYQNRASVDSSYLNTDAAGGIISSFAGSDVRDVTSWLGELSIVYHHQFSRCLTLRLGYNALAALDVALATENFHENIDVLTLGPLDARNDGNVVYHGPNVGLVWTR